MKNEKGKVRYSLAKNSLDGLMTRLFFPFLFLLMLSLALARAGEFPQGGVLDHIKHYGR
jgi:hypothetical protein